jgi:hypothetical protein
MTVTDKDDKDPENLKKVDRAGAIPAIDGGWREVADLALRFLAAHDLGPRVVGASPPSSPDQGTVVTWALEQRDGQPPPQWELHIEME